MLVQQKIVQLETVYLSCSDIAEAIESEAVGVCRAIISPDVAEFWCKAWNAARTGRVPRILSYRRDEGHIAIE